ncbi:MAG TPA: hypothetical protein DHU59_12855 [Clostridiales bacterium]|nr:hypothetical protein [Clostridiales bacterium]
MSFTHALIIFSFAANEFPECLYYILPIEAYLSKHVVFIKFLLIFILHVINPVLSTMVDKLLNCYLDFTLKFQLQIFFCFIKKTLDIKGH